MLSDVGVGPKYVNDIIVVLKAYTTRVGNGLFGMKQIKQI
ncbi:hypothetical protein MSIBF_A3720006 [groundwater metagenome]|uniref:Uncharacterized protein n=1 Tax=groundwater metagenome TaxID=717931 RepID=A0A098EE88_9ZZZZ